MATLRQKRLAKELILNEIREEPLNAGALLEKVGYSESVASARPGTVISSEGVKEALDELGFTEANAKKVVAKILLSGKEESAQLKAADMIFKVKGSYAPTESKNLNVDVKLESKDLGKHDSLREEYEAKLKQSYLEE